MGERSGNLSMPFLFARPYRLLGNLPASTDRAVRARLAAEMSDGEWQSAEAWLAAELACQIELSMLAPKAPTQGLLALH